MIVTSTFRPAPWLRGPHRQTLFASPLRPTPPLATVAQRLELPDGDFLDLAWLPTPPEMRPDAPLVIVLHGLTGSIKSKYARGLLRRVAARGWRGLLMHFRGASAEPNRLPRGYHSGDTGDFAHLVALLHRRYPLARLAAVGYSLGGNVLLKYLGEQGAATALTAGVAVSVPFDLARCVDAINRGAARVYQRYLMGYLHADMQHKFAQIQPPFPMPDLAPLTHFRAFDDALTAPLNGFADANDYYRRASSRPFLKRIAIPTLVLHALDDPLLGPGIVPGADELAPSVRLELSARGGHIGFVAASRWQRPKFWLEERIPAYLEQQLL